MASGQNTRVADVHRVLVYGQKRAWADWWRWSPTKKCARLTLCGCDVADAAIGAIGVIGAIGGRGVHENFLRKLVVWVRVTPQSLLASALWGYL
jgi:hypothetical protein